MDLLLVLLGVALLYWGGEALVRGSVSLARLLGLSPLVIGLTVVSFGTSTPELASTLAATLRGSPEVAFGNVVGSNIANIGLILGLSTMLWPIATTPKFLRREVPFMLVASALLFPMVLNGVVTRLEGLLLVGLLTIFLLYLLRTSPGPETIEEFDDAFGEGRSSTAKSLLLIAGGIILLVLGARALVTGGINIARVLGISERVIGLTMVALGTSLPELASSIAAARNRETGILLGNLIGSNIFNVLAILGTTAMIRPVHVDPQGVWLDLAVMLGVSALVWPFLATKLELERWEGFVLLTLYGFYIFYLFV
ncbi:MAG: calcium/sodium antiporter [Acidobacteriota bacterium]|nr:calcium/sodium antiporter [Acidobacteriota bacterium]